MAIYLAADSGDPDGKLAELCGQFADARDWVVVGVFVDSRPRTILSEREGWQRMAEALSHGAIQGAGTWMRAMVADTTEEWSRLVAILADPGGFLVSGSLNVAGQSAYGPRPRLAAAPPGTPRVLSRHVRGEQSGTGGDS